MFPFCVVIVAPSLGGKKKKKKKKTGKFRLSLEVGKAGRSRSLAALAPDVQTYRLYRMLSRTPMTQSDHYLFFPHRI